MIAPRSALDMLRVVARHRRILASVTRVELAKRYAGSVIGFAWVFLYPALLLGIYLFVYLVIFKMRFPGFSEVDYTLYVFAGLVPYIGFMEAMNAGAVSIKQNMHLIRNVMLPIELIPVRTVTVALASEVVALGMVILLALAAGRLSPHIVWLPVVLLLQVMFLVGMVLIVAALAVALPDVAYFVNLAVLLLMFLSPIGFKPDMVPGGFWPIIYFNPIFYMGDSFRMSLLSIQPIDLRVLAMFAALSLASFALGAAFFRRFKGVLVDYE
jgi:homopolymeric O-antigen transport system permease protein